MRYTTNDDSFVISMIFHDHFNIYFCSTNYVHCFKNKRIEQSLASFSKPLLFTIALGANIYSLIDLYEDVVIVLLILGSKMFLRENLALLSNLPCSRRIFFSVRSN